MSRLTWAPLQDLSLVRLHNGRVPRVPTNAERMAAYRPFLPVQFANAHDWQKYKDAKAEEAKQ